MIHIRVDDEFENSKRKFACGIGPDLPEGDSWYFASEVVALQRADCPGCNPRTPKALDAIADRVLAYKPKPKSKPARKRARRSKKIQRDSCI